MVLSLEAMPPSIVAALNGKFAMGTPAAGQRLIAPREADWASTDVVSPGALLPGRRFIAGGRQGRAWFVWYERGGIAHTYFAAVFELPEGARSPTRIAHRQTAIGDLCAATIALLNASADGSPDSNDW